MLKIVAISASTIAAIAVGFAALLFSPTSCGCLSPAQGLLLQANLDYSNGANIDMYSFGQIEQSLNIALSGRKVTPDDRHRRFINCHSLTQAEFECSDVLAQSRLLERGYVIRIKVDEHDNFQRASLRQYWAWL